MSSPSYSILFSAPVSGTVGTGVPGTVLIPDALSGLYVVATTANRAGRRSTGIALQAFMGGQAVEIQQLGRVNGDLLTTLGPGSESWVRVSATGTLERAAVSGSDDVVGKVYADGTFVAVFGFLDAAMVNGGGGSPTGAAGGDLSGTYPNPTVAKVNGVAYPAGALTTGTVPRATGASTVGYGALDLANTNAVTGILPTGNVATTLTGKTLTTATIVAASNTLTDTSATTGDILRHNGTRFVRLARGSANQVLTVNSGGTDIAWAPAAGGGGSSAGGSGQVQTSDGAGGFTAPTDVLAGADFLSIGASPAASGNLRLPNLGTIYGRDAANAADILMITGPDASDRILFGDAANDYFRLTPNGGDSQFNVTGEWVGNIGVTQVWQFRCGGVDRWRVAAAANESASPIVGYQAASSPYSAHGLVDVPMANANHVCSAAEYGYTFLNCTSTPNLSANRSLTLPTPASDAAGYMKYVRNSQAGAFSVVVGCGGANTAVITVGKGAWVQCDASFGCRLITALI